METYATFAEQLQESKRALLELLIGLRRQGKSVAGYGAPGKGNTLLNYCGIRTDFLEFTVDRNPYKQGRFLPGTHVPILSGRANSRTPAGLYPDSALELEKRDRLAIGLCARMGREIHRAHSDSRPG